MPLHEEGDTAACVDHGFKKNRYTPPIYVLFTEAEEVALKGIEFFDVEDLPLYVTWTTKSKITAKVTNSSKHRNPGLVTMRLDCAARTQAKSPMFSPSVAKMNHRYLNNNPVQLSSLNQETANLDVIFLL